LLVEDIQEQISDSSMALLKEIIKSADTVSLLLQNLLEWVRTQGETADFAEHPINLKSLVQTVFSTLQSQGTVKRVSLQNNVPGDAEIRGDVTMLQTVLRNLVSNALKFSHPGAVVRVDAHYRDEGLVVEVIDSGTGMDQKAARDVLNFNSRASSPGTQGESGTGFGLVLCRDLLEKMGGQLELHSEIGKGTTACMMFPGYGQGNCRQAAAGES
jgi:signal transduction histidine kinase